MKNLSIFLLSFMLVISFAGCDPNDDSDSVNNPSVHISDAEFAKNFGAATQRDFIGQVVDKNNEPIVGASVKIGSSTVQTDANGVFIINDAEVYEKFAYITATKNGYVNGSRSMVPTNGKNSVRIMLIPSTPVQTIASGASTTVNLPNGTQVVFDGAFADENGNAYTGNVSVSMFHLESSDANIGSLMPGMLYAKNDQGQAVGLETFGMMHVELRGSGGQKLQIASGHSAQMTMQIDNSQLATSPATIPLWHFDETNGYWKEEGFATKQGNKYVGNVSHFSWWNCDAFFAVVNITVTIQDAAGNPIYGGGTRISIPNGPASDIGLTNQNGQISGPIPANQIATLLVYDTCGNNVQSMQIGPFSTNTTLPVIVISNETQSAKIKGSFVKCDGEPVSDGYVIFHNGTHSRIVGFNSGNFEFSTLACADSEIFELEGIDVENLQSTGKIAYHFNFPETHIGTLKSCNNAPDFIMYQIDDNIRYITTPLRAGAIPHFTMYDYHYFALWRDQTNFLPPGNYTTADGFILRVYGDPYTLVQYNIVNNVVFHINKIGAVGDYMDVTFEGTFVDALSITRTIRGILHIKREA